MAPQPRPPDIEDLRAGVDAAWAEAVRQLGPSLRAFAAVRGAPDPDGVLGDVFLELSRGIDQVQGGWAGFRTLAYVIARRRVIDELRRAARRPTLTIDGLDLEALAGGDVEQEAMDRLERQRVQELLDLVTPIQRDVLTLRFVAGLAIREVAEVTGSTETAVKANQRRAVATIRRHLEREEGPAAAAAVRDLAETLGSLS